MNLILSSIAKIIPDDAMITSSFGGTIEPSTVIDVTPGVSKWFFAKPGNYPLANNLTLQKVGIILYDGNTWKAIELDIPDSAFAEIPFNLSIDLSKDHFSKYTELLGTTTFNLKEGSNFGKIAYVKLTGGTVVFPSDFVPQLGTTDYDPTKTNVIAFWKEYDKVRYFNETSALEPLPTDDIVTSYQFQNRTPNALLSTIPHIGAVLTGNIADHSISTSGQFLRRLTTATSGAAAIAVSTEGVVNYKATFLMSIYNMLDILIGGNTYDNYVNYINIRAQSPASDVVWVSASNPTGTTIATTPKIPYPQVDWYIWEFVVNGSQVKFYCNGNFIVEYTNPNTGNYFSFILNRKEDGLKSFKIEKL